LLKILVGIGNAIGVFLSTGQTLVAQFEKGLADMKSIVEVRT
jgi:hypothetical protein